MSSYRNAQQRFPTVAALVAYTALVNKANDSAILDDTNDELIWKPGLFLTHNPPRVVVQTSQALIGSWLSPAVRVSQLQGSVSVPQLGNSVSTIASAAVTGLPVGTPISVSVNNGNTAYAGAAIPEGLRISFPSVIKVADTIEIEVRNETGSDMTGVSTLSLTISVLS